MLGASSVSLCRGQDWAALRLARRGTELRLGVSTARRPTSAAKKVWKIRPKCRGGLPTLPVPGRGAEATARVFGGQ